MQTIQIYKMKTLLFSGNGILFLMLILLVGEIKCNPVTSVLPVDIRYTELQDLGTSCYPKDFCQGNGSVDSSCDCDDSCSKYNTCCLNSAFRAQSNKTFKTNLKCLPVYGGYGREIFMVDGCRDNETVDNLCMDDPEETNDPFLLIPVTSSVSGITYKNYFCAVCNEEIDSEQLHLWDLNVLGDDKLQKRFSNPQLKYNKTKKSWTVSEAEVETSSAPAPVIVSAHQNANATVKYCSSDLIEDCANNWIDVTVQTNCRAYMAMVTIFRNETRYKYRNPHCALCNFEDLKKVRCFEYPWSRPFAGPAAAGFSPASPAAGTVPKTNPLVDIFILRDRQRRCGRNMIYDKFSDKCRCDSRIYSKVNGKCVYKMRKIEQADN